MWFSYTAKTGSEPRKCLGATEILRKRLRHKTAILAKQETKHSKRYNPAAMEENRQALIHQRQGVQKIAAKPRSVLPFYAQREELAQKVENIEMVNKSHITRKGRKCESDLIYKVSIEPDYEAYFYILMELQPDHSMALRRLNYIVQFYQSLAKRQAARSQRLARSLPDSTV